MRYPLRERRRIAALRRNRAELSEILAFLEAAAEAGERFTPTSFDLSGLGPSLAGFPPLFPGHFPLDAAAAARVFRTLLNAFVAATRSEPAERALTELTGGRLDAVALAHAYCRADAEIFVEIAGRHRLDPALLLNLTELAVKPQFIAAARALEKTGRTPSERSDHCPACGSPADLAYIADQQDAESVAVAVCRLCETEWPITRIRCLNCGNQDADSLSYLQVEGEETGRVSVCNKCQHYLPVLDPRGRLEIAPAVERTTLAHLDLVAQDRGFQPLAALLAQTLVAVTD